MVWVFYSCIVSFFSPSSLLSGLGGQKGITFWNWRFAFSLFSRWSQGKGRGEGMRMRRGR